MRSHLEKNEMVVCRYASVTGGDWRAPTEGSEPEAWHVVWSADGQHVEMTQCFNAGIRDEKAASPVTHEKKLNVTLAKPFPSPLRGLDEWMNLANDYPTVEPVGYFRPSHGTFRKDKEPLVLLATDQTLVALQSPEGEG